MVGVDRLSGFLGWFFGVICRKFLTAQSILSSTPPPPPPHTKKTPTHKKTPRQKTKKEKKKNTLFLARFRMYTCMI